MLLVLFNYLPLPMEMIYEIYNYVDKECLLDSRRANSQWKTIIESDQNLMKAYTLNIKAFPKTGLETKIKSIKFQKLLPLKTKNKSLEELFIKIGSTVEQVIFDFEKYEDHHDDPEKIAKRRVKEKLMFSLILRHCTTLKSLIIKSQDDNYGFIKDCGNDPRYAAALSLIQSLSVNVRAEYLGDLKQFVLSLPNLCSLELNCGNVGWEYKNFGRNYYYHEKYKLINLILDHLWEYNCTLKEISFASTEDFSDEFIATLFLYVGKFHPSTNVNHKINLNRIVNFVENEDMEVDDLSCRIIRTGFIRFFDDTEEEGTNRIGSCTNLYSLDIEIHNKRQIAANIFGFVQNLKKLNTLEIINYSGGGIEENAEEEEGLFVCAEVFPFGIPSLKTLEYGFKELAVNSASFHLCFPNLTNLTMKDYFGNLNEDFIYKLTQLQQLEYLTLEFINELNDQHLTKLYDFTTSDQTSNKNNGPRLILPAICGFKCLTEIHLERCYKLTDKCLKYGLEFSDTIERIILARSGNPKVFNKVWNKEAASTTTTSMDQLSFPRTTTTLESNNGDSNNSKFPNLSWSACL